MTGITCNFAAICVDPDCKFNHPISIKDRRVVRGLYDGIVRPDKAEPKPEKRRANCKFGQICFNEGCGFRHRLTFEHRMILVNGFNDAKLKSMKTEKIVGKPKSHEFVISARNTFDCLEVADEVDEAPMVSRKCAWEDMCSDEELFDDFPALVRA